MNIFLILATINFVAILFEVSKNDFIHAFGSLLFLLGCLAKALAESRAQ